MEIMKAIVDYLKAINDASKDVYEQESSRLNAMTKEEIKNELFLHTGNLSKALFEIRVILRELDYRIKQTEKECNHAKV